MMTISVKENFFKMKKIQRLILPALFFVLGTVACTDQLQVEDQELQRDATEKTYLEYMLPSVIKNAASIYENLSYDDLLLPCTTMQYQTLSGETQNTYLDFYHTMGQWDTFYGQLRLVFAGIEKAQEEENTAYEGIFTIFKSFLFGLTVDLYGPAVYTDALEGRDGTIYPKFDKEETVYQGILDDLKKANQLIMESSKEISDSGDILYGGDLLKWRKLANSLRLRYLMRVSAKKPDWTKEGMAEILGDPATYPLLETVADNAGLVYLGQSSDNSWPGGPLNMGENDFTNRRPTRMLVDSLLKYNDPRIPVWLAPAQRPWTTDPAKDGTTETVTLNGYSYDIEWEYLPEDFNPDYKQYVVRTDSYWIGIFPGTSSSSRLRHDNGNYDMDVSGNPKLSNFSDLFHENANDLLQATFMNSDEVRYILAEASLKGFISGDAAQYYKKGVELSLKRWGIDDETAIGNFQSGVALKGTSGNKLVQIATQKWLGLLFVCTEAYLDTRRTGLPDYSDIVTDREIPVRFRYPTSESGLNKDNYDEAVSWLSPAEDNEHSKVWLLQ